MQTKKSLYTMIGLMMAGSFFAILTNMSMNVALPAIMTDLNVQQYSTIQWLATINMLVSGIVMPTTAYFITKFQSHRVFISAKLFFILGTMLAIFAPSFAILLLGRLIQSIGVAILMPLLMNVMLASFNRESRGKALGIYGLIYMLAPIAAPLYAGNMIDHFGWRMIFIAVLPFSLLVTALSFWKLKNILTQRPANFDKLSFILSSTAFASLLLGFSEASTFGWSDWRILLMLAMGALALGLFVFRQLRLQAPFLNLNVFRYGMFSLSALATFVTSMILYPPLILVPTLFQNIHGLSSLESGLLTIPGALVVATLMPIAGRLYDKIGIKPLALLGFPLIAAASFALSNLTLETSALYVGSWFAVRGIGLGLLLVPLGTNGLNQIPASLNPSGAAINNTIQQLGGAIGTAVFVTLKSGYANRFDGLERYGTIAAMNHIFLIMTAMALFCLVLGAFMKKKLYQPS